VRDTELQSAAGLGNLGPRWMRIAPSTGAWIHLSHHRQRVRAMAGRRHTYPANMASTTTTSQDGAVHHPDRDGHHHRAIYQITILHDLLKERRRAGALSRKLEQPPIYTFGGGCIGGLVPPGLIDGRSDRQLISNGYALASSTLTFRHNCNDLIASETR